MEQLGLKQFGLEHTCLELLCLEHSCFECLLKVIIADKVEYILQYGVINRRCLCHFQ
jgi:hypothetical protein